MRFRLLVTSLAALCFACSDSPVSDHDSTIDESDAVQLDDADLGVAENGLAAFYDELQEDALDFGFEDGEWLEDFGDASAFGPLFYFYVGTSADNSDYLEMARQGRDFNLTLVEHAADDIVWYMDNMEDVFMALMGLVEYAGVANDTDLIEPIDRLIDMTDQVVAAANDYFEISVGEFAADLYGPTSVTAGVALIYLQYAKYIDNDRTQSRIDRAVEIVEAVNEKVWDEDHYRFRPDEERLFLYPNSTMIIVLNRLYELTGDAQYLERAELVFEGIQPLRNAELGFYQSPYSQEYQGAETDEYSTLSSQNYLSLALMLTYQNTSDQLYLDEVLVILDFFRLRLHDHEEGKLLHHWIDGRLATEDDPEYFCSGCNVQTLYILRYLKEEVGFVFN